jgi:uncharacterized protein YerC
MILFWNGKQLFLLRMLFTWIPICFTLGASEAYISRFGRCVFSGHTGDDLVLELINTSVLDFCSFFFKPCAFM